MTDLSFTPDRSDVQTYLHILQNVIRRMASNSRSCKTWCIALVSGLLVFSVRADTLSEYLWIILFPIVTFLALDTYYLALERRFRTTYEEFLQQLHSGTFTATDLYAVRPTGSAGVVFRSALCSPAIWLFYGPLVAVLLLILAFL